MPPMGPPGPPPRGGHFLSEDEKNNRPKVTKELLVRIFSYLKPYIKQFLLVVFCIIISSVLGLLPSVLTGKIIDDGLIGQNLYALITLIIISLLVGTIIAIAMRKNPTCETRCLNICSQCRSAFLHQTIRVIS